MKFTINQIAEMAQVSKGTVSKAINGHKGVGQATRDRILTLAKMLDFHPDASARALAMQKTSIIGLLIPHESISLSEHYWPALLAGVSRQATLDDLNLMILTPTREGDISDTINQIMKRKSIDGLIIGSDLLDKESYSRMVLSGVPFVLIGHNPEFQHYSVDTDSFQGTNLIVRHLVAKGYKRIGALFGPEHYHYIRAREASYHHVLNEAGLAWRAVGYSEYYAEATYAALNSLIDAHPDMDCLFVGAGGQFLFDALHVLTSRGIKMPPFGVGTYDDYQFLDFLQFKISAVRQPSMETGSEAVRILVGLLHGQEPQTTVVTLENSLVER